MHKQKITDELITEAIVKTSRDRYGQTIMVNLQVELLFPDRVKDVKEYLKTSKKYRLSTYSFRNYGITYEAICKR